MTFSNFSDSTWKFVRDPNFAILKSEAFKTVEQIFNLYKLHDPHIYDTNNN